MLIFLLIFLEFSSHCSELIFLFRPLPLFSNFNGFRWSCNFFADGFPQVLWWTSIWSIDGQIQSSRAGFWPGFFILPVAKTFMGATSLGESHFYLVGHETWLSDCSTFLPSRSYYMWEMLAPTLP